MKQLFAILLAVVTFSASAQITGHNVTTSTLGIGVTNTNEYLNGKIGQALIYNRALTSTEIQQNYTATRTRYGV